MSFEYIILYSIMGIVALLGLIFLYQRSRRQKALGPYAGANPAWIRHVRKTLPVSWIPITERAPEERQVVITYHKETGVDIMRCYILKGEDTQFGVVMFRSASGFLTDDVTHWIPLSKRIQEVLTEAKYV